MENLQFTIDKPNKTIVVSKEFNASLSQVWDAFTKQKDLDEWWAPKPWASRTKEMNFEVGGQRFYAMVGPEGQEHWAIQQFKSITPKSNFKMYNTFADKDGNADASGSEWDLTFSEQNGKTTVTITITNESLERMEQQLEMGFKEGFTMTLESLAKHFSESR